MGRRKFRPVVPLSAAAHARMTPGAIRDIFTAQALYDAGDWDACEPVIRKLLKRGFKQPLTYDALGSVAQYQGRLEVALTCFRKAVEVDPEYHDARNRVIMILDALPNRGEDAWQERRLWWKRHGEQWFDRRRPHLNSRDPDRRLRVGYVSGDFQYHSASTAFHRIITRHTDQVLPFLYSSTPHNKHDVITNTYRVMPGWRDVVGAPDSLLADKIRTDQIDILVDLSGFTAHNRLPAFCFKPAPIQVAGWGYPLPTGFPCFDGLLTDRVVNPVQLAHTERMIYLPCVIDYEGVQGLPPATPLPCLTERPTFGVFQRSLKLNPDNLGVFRQILERLPESRLIFKAHYCDSIKTWILAHFGAQAAQLEIRGATSSFDHKVQYGEVDLNLDPWPQGGGMSACDALHMGVPFVTLSGDRGTQRAGASLLTAMGMTEFIATTREDYIAKAVALVTTRRDELAALRPILRERLAASPIVAGYLEAVEATYRELWREWCAKPMSIADARYRLEQAS